MYAKDVFANKANILLCLTILFDSITEVVILVNMKHFICLPCTKEDRDRECIHRSTFMYLTERGREK